MLKNLGKMMKYEFKAAAKTLLPLYLAFLVLSIPLDLTMLTGDMGGGLFVLVMTLAGFGFFVASIVMTFLILIQRFNRNIYGDQGYLTMTLPVSTHTQILTKTLSALIWSVIFTLFFLVTVLIGLLILGGKIDGLYNEILSEIISDLDAGALVIMVLSSLVNAIAIALQAYAAISIGHRFPKNYKVVGIITFVAFSLAENIIVEFLDRFFNTLGETNLTVNGNVVISNGIGLSGIPGLVWQLLLCAVFYTITWYLVDRKLNLQ